MARRNSGNMSGEQYLANTNESSLEVHDLDNENKNCQIDEILDPKPYDSLEKAKEDGYDPCDWCLEGSTR